MSLTSTAWIDDAQKSALHTLADPLVLIGCRYLALCLAEFRISRHQPFDRNLPMIEPWLERVKARPNAEHKTSLRALAWI